MTSRPLRKERGMALLMVLITTLLITAIVIELSYTTQVSATLVRNLRDGEKAYELARAAFRWSLFRLQLDSSLDQMAPIEGTNYGGRKDDLLEMQWAMPLSYPFALTAPVEGEPPPPPELLDGSFVTALIDESSRINLNDVGSGGPAGSQLKWSGASEVLENLLLSPRFQFFLKDHDHREIMWAIEDWIDQDSEINHLAGGIEDAEYETEDRDLKVKNGPFYSVEEIRNLKPMNEEVYEELKPFVTVYPFDARFPRVTAMAVNPVGKINVNTAPLEIIAATLSRDAFETPAERYDCAQKFVRSRKGIAYRGIGKGREPSFLGFLEQMCGADLAAGGKPPLSPGVEHLLDIRSDTFRVEATGLSNNVEKTIHAVVSRQNVAKMKILYWRVI